MKFEFLTCLCLITHDLKVPQYFYENQMRSIQMDDYKTAWRNALTSNKEQGSGNTCRP
jgi:hypothetical protein